MDYPHEANVPQSGLEEHGRFEAVKEKLGQVGRKLKRIELRESIVAHPFIAVGIGAALGAALGLARPMPRRSRIGGAVFAALSAIGLKVIREAAMQHLGGMAKDWLHNRQQGVPQAAEY